ncbi:hypothetical protein EDB19DRAFT_1768126 [Suillus lakei]|nr:hypothetical protein EDB19DRAFT_1768126 [Suillus lakei]
MTRRYVRGSRNCIAGSVNWLYETERYPSCGTKGNEVRAFGWAFVPAVLDWCLYMSFENFGVLDVCRAVASC